MISFSCFAVFSPLTKGQKCHAIPSVDAFHISVAACRVRVSPQPDNSFFQRSHSFFFFTSSSAVRKVVTDDKRESCTAHAPSAKKEHSRKHRGRERKGKEEKRICALSAGEPEANQRLKKKEWSLYGPNGTFKFYRGEMQRQVAEQENGEGKKKRKKLCGSGNAHNALTTRPSSAKAQTLSA